MNQPPTPLKLSDLPVEEQVVVLKTMIEALHTKMKALRIDLEFWQTGKSDYHGATTMKDEDRLMNRLVADLVLSDNGISAHAKDDRNWVVAAILADSDFPAIPGNNDSSE